MISFIYFDIGGVMIKDFSSSNKWDSFERDLLKIPVEKIPAFSQLFDRYESSMCMGKDVDSFIPEFSQKFGVTYPANFSILDQFIALFESNQTLWPIVESLKSTCRVGLLTNMYPRMLNQIKSAGLLPATEWDIIIDSSIEKAQKPDPEIYKIAESKTEVDPHEILFIDNMQVNLEPAKSRGWQTFHYDSANYEQSSQKLMEFWHQCK